MRLDGTSGTSDTKNDTEEQKISRDKCLSDNSCIIIPGMIIGAGNNNGNSGDRSLGDTILTVYRSPIIIQ